MRYADSSLAFWSALSSLILYSPVDSVHVDFGYWLHPLVSRTGDSAVFNNWDVVVQLKCMARYPTEWVANFDDQTANYPDSIQLEWTDRIFDKTIEEPEYDYISWIQVRYDKLREEELLICRSVFNSTDSVLVKLTPNPAGTEQFNVTMHPNSGVRTPVNDLPTDDSSSSCQVKFEIAHMTNGYYWRCGYNGEEPHGEIRFHDCVQAELCANNWRTIRIQPHCFNVSDNISSIYDQSWAPMPRRERHVQPGIAICTTSDPTSGQQSRGALEYFFDGKRKGLRRQMHFSQTHISMKDLIWMNPPLKDVYYTRETLDTRCMVPKYGFSFYPVVNVTRNGSQLWAERGYVEENEGSEFLLTKQVSINLRDSGTGTYVVHCLGPVWNTTEWADYSKTVVVRQVTPPHFDVDHDNVAYQDEDTHRKLVCNADGDPEPGDIRWDVANAPSTRAIGKELVITRVSNLLPDVITCTATNFFGESATKIFRVRVEPKSVTVPIVIGTMITTLIVVGLLLLYFKLWRRTQEMAALLTDDEVQEFLEGRRSTTERGEVHKPNGQAAAVGTMPFPGYVAVMNSDGDDTPISIEGLPYNSKLEVPKENFIIDFKTQLGAGQYGLVYKGYIKLNALDRNPTPVAVKTVHKHVDVDYFKALMAELKILAYVGHHVNVAKLVGACTRNIKNRELYVGMELCKTSLLDFLQDNRDTFENSFPIPNTTKETSFSECQTDDIYSGASLIRWAAEIAAGMDFLSQKRIVHGDLAARNVLLSFDLHAKISDFGLARQLITYNYTKSQNCPLPWKWMAIESLTQRKFSTKSDVWAFGVTLWELFTLGNVPYPTAEWNASFDFMEQLLGGLRLSKPKYANDEIYSMMRQCWTENPKNRPTCADIMEVLSAIWTTT